MNDVVVGVDVGYGETKVARPSVGAPAYAGFRSIPVPVPLDRAELGGGLRKRDTLRVWVDDKRYEVGADAELIAKAETVQALHKDYIETPGYRALMLAALLTAKQTHIDHLVTGLPVRHMLDKRDALKQLFAGHHQVTPEFSVTIETVHVVPQPLGGLLDFASERHEHYPVRDMTVLVIDPGHFTTDWLIVDGLRAVRRRSDSMETGMAAVIAEIRDRLRRKYGGTPTDAKLIERIETGRDVRVHNQPVHIQPLLAEVAQQVAEPVVQRIKSTVADFDDIDLILLVGGGAAVFEPVVRSVLAASGPEIATAHASVFANVRGYYRFGERAASQVMRASR